MKRTKEDAEKTRTAILDAALAVFSSIGYQAARLQDIAEAAGTTRGAIYHHFDNKAALYITLMKEANQHGSSVVQTAVSQGGTIADILHHIFVATLNLLASDQTFRQISALSLFKTGVSAELTEIDDMRQQEAAALITQIAGALQLGIDAGDIRDDVSPTTLARAFIAYQNGISWLWLASGESFSLRDEADGLAEVLLHGIAKK